MADNNEPWENHRRDSAPQRLETASENTGHESGRVVLTARHRVWGTGFGDIVVKVPRAVLVLEDSMIIAMEAEDIFRAIGSSDIHVASNLQQARDLVDAQQFDFALLDVNLGAIMSFDFARLLRERGIPFGFSSGYPDSTDFPEDLQKVSLLRKPFGEDTIRRHLADVFGSVTQ